jgi:dGTPase
VGSSPPQGISLPTSPRYERHSPESKPDFREPAQRDYDRIIYSSAFKRLVAVTQVVSPTEGHVFHNRLTHSLRVAQVARRLAQKFLKADREKADAVGGIDPDVVEAAAVGHDLGHPPFGHVGEQELRSQVQADPESVWDGFEGNAQSFRIVTKLALRSPNVRGLNLTRTTLNAMLKYPWTRQAEGRKADKYGVYNSEEEDFRFARELQPKADDDRKCVEAEIMDWADDVTYAVHDAEDFYRARLIPLDRLASLKEDAERRRLFDGMYQRTELAEKLGSTPRAELEERFLKVITTFPISEPYTGTRDQRSRLRDFSSFLIGKYVDALQLKVPTNHQEAFVIISSQQKTEVTLLKALTWFYVIYNPALATQQFAQRKMIAELFEIFLEAGISHKEERLNIFPFAFRDDVREQEWNPKRIKRLVSDMIASMGDEEIVRLYRRITGVSLGSALDHV